MSLMSAFAALVKAPSSFAAFQNNGYESCKIDTGCNTWKHYIINSNALISILICKLVLLYRTEFVTS